MFKRKLVLKRVFTSEVEKSGKVVLNEGLHFDVRDYQEADIQILS